MMIVNSDKFQSIIIDGKMQQNNPTSININDININSKNGVRLLGLERDSKLNFDKYITHIRKNSTDQSCFLCRLKLFLNTDHKKF